jgi:hypothetical protein
MTPYMGVDQDDSERSKTCRPAVEEGEVATGSQVLKAAWGPSSPCSD